MTVAKVTTIDSSLPNNADTRVDLLFAEPNVPIPEQPARQAPGVRFYFDARFVARTPIAPEPEPAAVCVGMTGMHFDSDKCFLLPSALDGMRALVGLYKKHPRGELLVVGHTDTSGELEYNETLSLERAKSVVAFLGDMPDAWLEYYEASTPPNKRWGRHEDRWMFEHVTKKPFTVANIKAYQKSKDLDDDGKVGPKTRKSLVADYMNSDGTSLSAELTAVAHGCGENSPLVDTDDNTSSADNRRVELFLFEPKATPVPGGEISKAGSVDYPKWKQQVVEHIAFDGGRNYPFIFSV